MLPQKKVIELLIMCATTNIIFINFWLNKVIKMLPHYDIINHIIHVSIQIKNLILYPKFQHLFGI